MSVAFSAPLLVRNASHPNTRTEICERRNLVKVWPRSCAKNEQGDFIERAWTAIFGAKEKEPLGLKRFDRDRFPELYYGTLDEMADAVETDDEMAAAFRPLLKYTSIETRSLQLLYDANRDGWSAEEYHEKVDRKGACVVVAKTSGGAICGGYAPKGFVGYGETRGSKAAFMFTWPDGDLSKPAMKMLKVAGAGLATIDQPDTGPRFGSGELFIPLRPPRADWEWADRDRNAMSKLGSYYQKRPDGGNSLFAEGESGKGTLLVDLKVYAGVYEEGEEIPFSDAVPFALE